MDRSSRRRSSSSRYRTSGTQGSIDHEHTSKSILHTPRGIQTHRISTQSGEVPEIAVYHSVEASESDSSLKLEEDLATLEAQAKRRDQQQAEEEGSMTLSPTGRKSRMNPKRASSMVAVGTKRSSSPKTSTTLRSAIGVALAATRAPSPSAARNSMDGQPRRRGRQANGSPTPNKQRDPRNFSSSPCPSTRTHGETSHSMRCSETENGLTIPTQSRFGPKKRSASSLSLALAENPLFEGVKTGAILSLARVAIYKSGNELMNQMYGSTILFGGEISSDSFVFVIEEGSVYIEDNGENLGMLSKGAIFGEGPAFGRSEVQPFTVKLAKNAESIHSEDSFGCWCIPSATLRYTIRQFPDVKLLLEERIAEQTKKLLGPRAFRLLFFSHCGSGFQERLLPLMRTLHYCRGDDIVKGGEEADSMLMVVSGSIKLGRHKVPKTSPKAQNRPQRRSTLSGSVRKGSLGTLNRASTAGSEDIDDNSVCTEDDDASSFASSCESSDGEFLPKLSEMHSRSSPKVVAVTSEALCFGEGVLLGFHSTMGRRVIAAQDCIVLSLGKDGFDDVVERHPRERSSFQELRAARYQELRRSDLARLANVDLFSRCSDAFLAKVAQISTLQLFFTGSYIIAEGFVPKGVLLLMGGRAEQIGEDGDVIKVDSPHSFGTLEWLGVTDVWEHMTLKASELCLVFLISREHLLDSLKNHPAESTAMVQQVLRHNGIRMSVSNADQLPSSPKQVGVVTASSKRPQARSYNVWHMPFCKGCDPAFVARFTIELQVCKLIPGQQIFSQAPWEKDVKKEDLDFLVILVNGTLQVDDTPRNSETAAQSWKYVHSPLVVTGFNRKHRAMVVTSSVCELHRLSMSSCCTLNTEFPNDLRKVLQRMLRFQQQRELKLGSSWWCPTKSLRHQAWFKDSDEDFLHAVVANLHTELYLPGDVLVAEGDPADSTMLLECGTAVIEKVDTRSLYSSDRIGDVHDGYWVGEMAMFAGETKRRATVKAVTACKIQRLYNKALVHSLDDYPTERQRFRELAEHRLRSVEKERLEDHDFFKDLDRSFLNLLRQKCKPRVFFANEIMMEQGDVADSLFILGQDSVIIVESDGYKGKKLIGRACLGTKALLSARPVKRASTVTTQNVCAVRVLTRDDWLDALKLCPEHQRWLGSFTKQQMAKIGEGRSAFLKRRAWDKIQQREMCASVAHSERLADPEYHVRPFRKRRPRHLECLDAPRPDSRARRTGKQHHAIATRPPPHPPEVWDCFNSLKTKVPHTLLPQLGNIDAEVFAMMSRDGSDEEEQRLAQSPSQQSFLHDECEKALGLVPPADNF